VEARWFRFPSNNCCCCAWFESLWTPEDPALWRKQCWIVDQQIWEETTGEKLYTFLKWIEFTQSLNFCWLKPTGVFRMPGWTGSPVHLLLMRLPSWGINNPGPKLCNEFPEVPLLRWVGAAFLGLKVKNTSTYWPKTMPGRLGYNLHHWKDTRKFQRVPQGAWNQMTHHLQTMSQTLIGSVLVPVPWQ